MSDRCQACGCALTSFDDWRVDIQEHHPYLIDANGKPDRGTFRVARCCGACLDAMDVDMWTTQGAWAALNPLVPFDQLPVCEKQ